MSAYPPVDLSQVETYPLESRASKVVLSDLVGLDAALPAVEPEAADGLRRLAEAVVRARRAERPVIVGYGAHVVKEGLSPALVDLIERGWITAVAGNGACGVHEVELALVGKTSEDVAVQLPAGRFGFADETGRTFSAAAGRAAAEAIGLGRAIGEAVLDIGGPGAEVGILAAAARKGIPACVFVAIGTDIVHMHPTCDGAALGAASHHDFRIFCSVVKDLAGGGDAAGGCYLNIGSAVILPEVFLKAVSVAINLGADLSAMTTANLDMIDHYRPHENVVRRPPGTGMFVQGIHGVLIPHLRQKILEGA